MSQQRPIRVYVKTDCPYSAGAKRLLDEKGLQYEEINITDHPDKRDEMIQAAGGKKTTPQVFFGDDHIGGFTELQELDRTAGVMSRLIENDEAQPQA